MLNLYKKFIIAISLFIENKFYNKYVPLKKMDINDKWYSIFLKHSWVILVAFVMLLVEKVIEAYTPFFLNTMIKQKNFEMFYTLIGLYLFSFVISVVGFQLLVRVERRITDALDELTSDRILSIDPVNHSTKSSGTLISKLKRAISATTNITYNLLIELPTKFIYIGVSVYFMFQLSFQLGIIVTLITFFSIIINYLYIRFVYQQFKSQAVLSDDQYVEALLENIAQAPLIRASFATNERHDLVVSRQLKKNFDDTAMYHAYAINYQLTKFLLTVSILYIAYFIFNSVQNNQIELGLAIAIITSYTIAAFQIITLGSNVLKVVSAITDFQTYIQYIRDLGEQSYPVLGKI
jgi:ABC-type multidrug transport system fused ATPase/permease subunit